MKRLLVCNISKAAVLKSKLRQWPGILSKLDSKREGKKNKLKKIKENETSPRKLTLSIKCAFIYGWYNLLNMSEGERGVINSHTRTTGIS